MFAARRREQHARARALPGLARGRDFQFFALARFADFVMRVRAAQERDPIEHAFPKPFQRKVNDRRDVERDQLRNEVGAQFNFQAVANKKRTNGSVFTVINNTSTNAIRGTFANLLDNSTFAAGRNNYQVSYAGGTGNDLTLTVVP